MKNQLAPQLRRVEESAEYKAESKQLMDYLFEGLNKKLNPLGLNILSAQLGFRRTMTVKDIFAKLKAAEIV